MRIATPGDVQEAQRLNTWLMRRPVDEVILDLDLELDRQDKQQVQSRLENLFNDCGCVWSPPAFALLFVGWHVLHWGSGYSWTVLGIGFVLATGAALVAKLIGLYLGHLRLKKELSLLWSMCVEQKRD